ncbi:MAG: four helix bundle protein [Gemmatimonadetes bacterium]|nr:four helix bundle protein [Gemmatimonadota bacterium]
MGSITPGPERCSTSCDAPPSRFEANAVEGYALKAPLQFRRHLRIALGSAAETECLLRLAQEVGYLSEQPVRELVALPDAVIGILVGLLRKPVASRSWFVAHGTAHGARFSESCTVPMPAGSGRTRSSRPSRSRSDRTPSSAPPPAPAVRSGRPPWRSCAARGIPCTPCTPGRPWRWSYRRRGRRWPGPPRWSAVWNASRRVGSS